MDDEDEQRPLEPSLLERERLGGRLLRIDAPLPRQLDHPRRFVHAPDPRTAPGERLRPAPCAAADVEHSLPDQVALADEELEELPPALVLWSQPVEAGGEPTVVRRRRRCRRGR